ncbi:hypothetical protein DL93DRAFT_2090599 [Clavulina sp. PMI_390]|nr:hypothetical protein DL93DRAFT_2090599 [Clavulina sp. PMI_390]
MGYLGKNGTTGEPHWGKLPFYALREFITGTKGVLKRLVLPLLFAPSEFLMLQSYGQLDELGTDFKIPDDYFLATF